MFTRILVVTASDTVVTEKHVTTWTLGLFGYGVAAAALVAVIFFSVRGMG